MIFKWLVLLLVLPLSAIGQVTTIQFDAPAFADKEVRLTQTLDPISGRDTLLAAAIADTYGHVTLTARLDKIGSYDLGVNRFIAPIYLESGSAYQLILFPNRSNTLVNTWQKGSFEYGFSTLDSTDINAAILKFDAWYFAAQVAYAENRRLSVLEKTCAESAERLLALHASDFYKTYASYGIAEMLLTAGGNKYALYEKYLHARNIELNNPAWFTFFDGFYANYFSTFDGKYGGAAIYNRLRKGEQPDNLDLLLATTDTTLAAAPLRYLVSLKSIAESYTDPRYPLEACVAWVKYLQATTTDRNIRTIAQRLLGEMTEKVEGKALIDLLPQWSGVNEAERAALPTLAIIHNATNADSQREISVLEDLSAKYGDFFQVVEFDLNSKGVGTKRSWERIELTNQAAIMDALHIYALPHFMWIDTDGIIRENGLAKPSEDLEQRLYKIQSHWKEADKIKVGKD